ncbi:hypothetical protein [Nitrosopumilus sp.]|uniref:hypothetical protein n=1 Tax=Nitrosopumilus sp. TaxID=2024843 RepID=UPI003B5C7E39
MKLSTLEQDDKKSTSDQYDQWEKQHNVQIVRPYTRKAATRKTASKRKAAPKRKTP